MRVGMYIKKGSFMGFPFESNNHTEFYEAADIQTDTQRLDQMEEAAEHFEDCSKNELQEAGNEGAASDAPEQAVDDFEDCGCQAEPMEAADADLPRDELYDYSDCGKGEAGEEAEKLIDNGPAEAFDEAVEEKPEINEITDETAEEQNQEARQDFNAAKEKLEEQREAAQQYQQHLECPGEEGEGGLLQDADALEEQPRDPEHAEQTDEEPEASIDNGWQESAESPEEDGTDTNGAREQWTEEKPEPEEELDEGKREPADNQEPVDEQTQGKLESIEEQEEGMDEGLETQTKNAAEHNEDLTREDRKEQSSKEAEGSVKDADEAETQRILKEKSNELDAAVEEEKEELKNGEALEAVPEEAEEEREGAQVKKRQKSMDAKVEEALAKDVISSEIKELAEENEAMLHAKKEEQILAQKELSAKFDEVLSWEKGTPDYQKSLQEFNDLKGRKESLDDQVGQLETQHESLDRKIQELRNAQMEKGEAAMAASAVTLAGVQELERQYEDAYYKAKPDKKELESVQEGNAKAIRELANEKEAIQLSMKAKMDQISDYVVSNQLDRFDTAHDPYYQSVTAEYLSMKQAYDKVSYSIVSLDENNRSISEMTGNDYASLWGTRPLSPIERVNQGTDIPSETNYFINETKANAVLAPFEQHNWEQLNELEQKKSIGRLADYHAELLGIEEKPGILYCRDAPEYMGEYSSGRNAIFINEIHIHNARETVDTLSHEYRHKYQYERAQRLETVRDLDYKQGLDEKNYIQPEEDYAAYQNQLVEADAREYAAAVLAKMDAMQKTHGVKPEKSRRVDTQPVCVYDSSQKSAKPEKTEPLPEQKREALEIAELTELKKQVEPLYENGKLVAGHVEEFHFMKEHHLIAGGHIEKVYKKTLEAAGSLSSQFAAQEYGGLYSSDIDPRALSFMALYHDTGMDSNIKAGEFRQKQAAFLADTVKRESFVSEAKANAAKNHQGFDRNTALQNFEQKGFGQYIRKNHSLESAVHVLQDRAFIEEKDVNADEVALACFLHSKSCSDVMNLEEDAQWNTAIQRLLDRVEEYNKFGEPKITFNPAFLQNSDGTLAPEKLAKMRSECLCLRIGDSNGHDETSHLSQNGKEIFFDLQAFDGSKAYASWREEIAGADVRIGREVLTAQNDSQGYSRMFAVGEGNFRQLRLEQAGNGTIKQFFVLRSGNAYPYCTQKCIDERLQEFATAPSLNYTPVIILGKDCTDEAFKKYKKFAKNAYERYGVKMEVRK